MRCVMPKVRNAVRCGVRYNVAGIGSLQRAIVEQHISIVGLDKHLFQHTIDDQSNALHFCRLFAKICKQTVHIKY